MNVNTNSAFNLLNQTYQQHNRPTQQSGPQNTSLISAIQTMQQIISHSQNNIHSFQTYPIQTPTNIINTSPINTLQQQSINNTQQTMIKLLTQSNQINIPTNQIYHSNSNQTTAPPLTICDSINQCPSIRRIVKLGVFQNKYGTQNTNKILEFMNNTHEFNSLNSDYQHSLIHHLSSNDKLQIMNMSNEYQIIHDFIVNFQNNNNNSNNTNNNNQVSLQELAFYNEAMDTIYNRVETSSSQDKIIDTADNITHSSNATHTQPQISNNNITSQNAINNIYLAGAIQINNQPQSLVVPLPNIKQSIRFNNVTPITPINNTNIPSLTIQSNQPTKQIIQSVIHPQINEPHLISISSTQKQQAIIKPPSFNEPNVNTRNPFSSPTNNYIQIQNATSIVNEPRNKNAIQISRKSSTIQQRNVENVRKFKCVSCKKMYKHLCNLKSHQKIHTDEALICPHCDKRFGRKANYKEHLRIHTGETPYCCKYCQRKFKHHHSWKDHVRIHTGEKPYHCTICSKKFKVGHNLTVHLRIHTGEKPYNCTVCLKTFRQKSALNSHLKRVHN